MEQVVRVKTCHADGTATVLCLRESACSGDCHKCSGCGAAKETIFVEAKNPMGAKPGELVTVKAESAPVLKAAVVMYMLPLVLFFVGYALGDALWKMGALVGCLSFVISIVLVVVYDRKVVKKRDTVYTITGYAKAAHLQMNNKGDHHID